jgi:hypothetical protein
MSLEVYPKDGKEQELRTASGDRLCHYVTLNRYRRNIGFK